MTANKQKVLHLESKFGRFVVVDQEILKPGPGELLVKVLAPALNPVDWKIQKYGICYEEYPAILGCDVAGDIAEVGEGVTNFSPGDRVFFQGAFENKRAGFQQYTIATASTTAKTTPRPLPDTEWSFIRRGLHHTPGFDDGLSWTLQFPTLWGWIPEPVRRIGKPLVILGGSSSVGQFAIQLAKLSGFSPIITTSSPKHTAHLESLGATHVVDRRSPSLHEEIKKITTAPIEYVYDAISNEETQQTGHDLLASSGHLIIVMPPALKEGVVEKAVTPVEAVYGLPQNRRMFEILYSNLTGLVADGTIKANRHQTLSGGLAGIIQGLQLLENDQVSGVKLVALPWQD